jgi:hypothetical protein
LAWWSLGPTLSSRDLIVHVRNWSYEVLEREVRANLVYHDFTRVGGGKVPDAKTMGRGRVLLCRRHWPVYLGTFIFAPSSS